MENFILFKYSLLTLFHVNYTAIAKIKANQLAPHSVTILITCKTSTKIMFQGTTLLLSLSVILR